MELRPVLKNQFRAALAMLRQAIDRCPGDLWASVDGPRSFWRIAYHTLFYAHLYAQPSDEGFRPSPIHRAENRSLACDPWPPGQGPQPYTKAEILDYWAFIDSQMDGWIDALDLDATDSGFSWYTMSKMEHQLVSLRHIQQHSGQLSELLMARAIDTDWIGGDRPATS